MNDMILRNAFRRKGRTTMTVVAVAISMTLLVSMLSIAEGILYNAQVSIEESKRDIIVSSGGIHGITDGHTMTDELKALENVSAASAVLITGGTELLSLNFTDEGSGEDKTRSALGIGIVPDDEFSFLGDETERQFRDIFEIKYNDWFEEGGDPHYDNNYTGEWTYEIILDGTFAQRHNLTQGTRLKINDHPMDFKIVGTVTTILSEELLMDFDFGIIIMHLSELQSLLNLTANDLISSVSVSLEDEHKDVSAARDVAQSIKNKYPYYSVATKEDRLDSIEDELSLAQLLYTAIGSVSMVIGLLFVACIMIMSVFERTNEFGMMRAIGISKKTIFVQTLLESMVLVLIGAGAGIILGYFGSAAMGDWLRETSGLNREFTVFTPNLVISSIIIVIGFGSLISIYPAWQAARKKILDALRFIR
jgi:ABC-type antimicrobial peptide transport system permease subunit